jgi:hypothetical protein
MIKSNDPDPSINKQKIKITMNSVVLWLLSDMLSLKTDVYVRTYSKNLSKENLENNSFFVRIYKYTAKKEQVPKPHPEP